MCTVVRTVGTSWTMACLRKAGSFARLKIEGNGTRRLSHCEMGTADEAVSIVATQKLQREDTRSNAVSSSSQK